MLHPDGPAAFGPRDEILKTVTGPATNRAPASGVEVTEPAARNNEDDHDQLESA